MCAYCVVEDRSQDSWRCLDSAGASQTISLKQNKNTRFLCFLVSRFWEPMFRSQNTPPLFTATSVIANPSCVILLGSGLSRCVWDRLAKTWWADSQICRRTVAIGSAFPIWRPIQFQAAKLSQVESAVQTTLRDFNGWGVFPRNMTCYRIDWMYCCSVVLTRNFGDVQDWLFRKVGRRIHVDERS